MTSISASAASTGPGAGWSTGAGAGRWTVGDAKQTRSRVKYPEGGGALAGLKDLRALKEMVCRALERPTCSTSSQRGDLGPDGIHLSKSILPCEVEHLSLGCSFPGLGGSRGFSLYVDRKVRGSILSNRLSTHADTGLRSAGLHLLVVCPPSPPLSPPHTRARF